MGIMQALAVLPGISRSGFTICGGLIAGKKREDVAKFSFLMSIPIIIASLVLEVYEYVTNKVQLVLKWYEILTGFALALLVGIISAKIMLKLVSNKSIIGFAIYLVAISILSFFVLF